MNIFEQATRMKLRFTSVRGDLSTEQLWDLPLEARDNFDLDNVARLVNNDLKAAGEESFVITRANPAKAKLELALEVVKHIIAVKLAEGQKKQKAAANKIERQKLLDILDQKQGAKLFELTPEQIHARLEELDQE